MIDLVAALKPLKFSAYSAGHCRLGNNVAGQIVPFAHDSNKERVPGPFSCIFIKCLQLKMDTLAG